MIEILRTPEGRFNYALNFLLKNEEEYSNNPDDPGRETNFGITQEELDEIHVQLKLPASVKDLTEEDVEVYYKVVWWNEYHYNLLKNITIAAKIFDLAVNIGPYNAHRIVQEALTYNGYPTLKIDGILGLKTRNVINEVCLYGSMRDLLNEIRERAKWYYTNLVEENPRLNKFLKRWLKRAER